MYCFRKQRTIFITELKGRDVGHALFFREKCKDVNINNANINIFSVGNYTGAYTANFNMRKVNVADAIDVVVSDVVYNSKGKSGYTMPVPKLLDNGKAVTIGKNKDIDPIAKTDYSYFYAEDTTLADGTEKYIGDRLSASDNLAEGIVKKGL